jgi:hypothetical protein
MAPIASAVRHLPQGILWTADCEARYVGTVDTRLHKSKIASAPWAVRRTRNYVTRVLVYGQSIIHNFFNSF